MDLQLKLKISNACCELKLSLRGLLVIEQVNCCKVFKGGLASKISSAQNKRHSMERK